jgi:hypothetical protein
LYGYPTNYYSYPTYDIFVMNVNGTGLQRLTNTPHQDLHPTWKPDGSTIAFSRGTQLVPNYPSGIITSDSAVYAVNADGTALRFLMQVRFAQYPTYPEWNNNPAWSPDGSKIAIEGHGNIWVANADGTSQQVLVERVPYVMYGSPAWTPDSSKLVFNRYGASSSGSIDVCRINADGTGFARIASSGRTPIFGADTTSLIVSGGYGNNEILSLQPYLDYYGIFEKNLTRAAGNDIEPSWGPSFNSAPVAQPQTVTLDEDTPADITLRATDLDNDVLQYAVIGEPQHGTLSANGAQLRYTPDADFYGADSFTFRAWDGYEYSNVATVTLVVRPVNDAPVAQDENFVMYANEEKTLRLSAPGLLANDSDAEGDTLQAVLTDAPRDADVTLKADGSFSFAPHNWRSEIYTVTYVVSDGKARSNPVTVTISVKPREIK